MPPAAALLLAADPTTGLSGEQFGAFAVAFTILVACIGWLLRRLTKTEETHAAAILAAKAAYDADLTRAKTEFTADIKAHREQLDIERQANRELYDRIIEQQARLVPILERAARVLEHAPESTR